MSEPLNGENWAVWCARILPVLKLWGLEGYIRGRIRRPDPAEDPEGADNWKANDALAGCLIVNNITDSEAHHVLGCDTSCELWQRLEAVHKRSGYQAMAFASVRALILTIREEGTDICDRLDKLQHYWVRINLLGDDNLKISDRFLKAIIAVSLPRTWDAFTERYVEGSTSSHQFIEILKEEYRHREARKHTATEHASLRNKRPKLATNQNGSLAN